MRYAVAVLVALLFTGGLQVFHWIALSRINAALGRDIRTVPPDMNMKLSPYVELLAATDRWLINYWLYLTGLVLLLALGVAWMLPPGKAPAAPAQGGSEPSQAE